MVIKKRVVAIARYVAWTNAKHEALKAGRLDVPCQSHTVIDDCVILVPTDESVIAQAIRKKSIKLQREHFICPICKWEVHRY